MNLKKSIFLCTLLACFTAGHAQDTYELVWADEFDSNSLVRNWNVEVTENPSNNELQYYTNLRRNVTIADGNLILTAVRENKGSKSFTSGRVNSNGKVSFTHGMIMARIKLPKTKQGLWPAFWMMGCDISSKGWPYCGELDIMECGNNGGYGGNEEKHFSAAVHWGENWQQHAYYSYPTVNSYSIEDDYHVFKCLWDENVMRCYLDDQKKPYFEALLGEDYGPYPYTHKPFHILFNLAVGGDFTGFYDPAQVSALPEAGSEAKMYVDWVRVYQKVKSIRCVENDMSKVEDKEVTEDGTVVSHIVTVTNTDMPASCTYRLNGVKCNDLSHCHNEIVINDGRKVLNK